MTSGEPLGSASLQVGGGHFVEPIVRPASGPGGGAVPGSAKVFVGLNDEMVPLVALTVWAPFFGDMWPTEVTSGLAARVPHSLGTAL